MKEEYAKYICVILTFIAIAIAVLIGKLQDIIKRLDKR